MEQSESITNNETPSEPNTLVLNTPFEGDEGEGSGLVGDTPNPDSHNTRFNFFNLNSLLSSAQTHLPSKWHDNFSATTSDCSYNNNNLYSKNNGVLNRHTFLYFWKCVVYYTFTGKQLNQDASYEFVQSERIKKVSKKLKLYMIVLTMLFGSCMFLYIVMNFFGTRMILRVVNDTSLTHSTTLTNNYEYYDYTNTPSVGDNSVTPVPLAPQVPVRPPRNVIRPPRKVIRPLPPVKK